MPILKEAAIAGATHTNEDDDGEDVSYAPRLCVQAAAYFIADFSAARARWCSPCMDLYAFICLFE